MWRDDRTVQTGLKMEGGGNVCSCFSDWKKVNDFYNLFYDEKQPLVYSGKKKEIIITFVPESDIRMLQYRQKLP